MTVFPKGKHDDQVDSTAQFLDWFKKPMPGWGIFEFYRQKAEALAAAEAKKYNRNPQKSASEPNGGLPQGPPGLPQQAEYPLTLAALVADAILDCTGTRVESQDSPTVRPQLQHAAAQPPRL
jgi:hypothetical protein